MLRRDFLRRTSLALAGGLILGDEALEAFARLTHQRKSFPGADVWPSGMTDMLTSSSVHNLNTTTYPEWGVSYAHRGPVWVIEGTVSDLHKAFETPVWNALKHVTPESEWLS
jgi:hypothetical protein